MYASEIRSGPGLSVVFVALAGSSFTEDRTG